MNFTSDNRYERSFYLGANTCNGFVSLYREFIDDFITSSDDAFAYIIKGGPGTGKSTFIKKVYSVLLENGFSDTVVLKCSGDPESLDGVASEKAGVLVCDGTAPHTLDASLPGINAAVINFSDFWSTKKLRENKADIIHLGEVKSRSYKEAYNMLKIAGNIRKSASDLYNYSNFKDILNDKIEISVYDILDYYGVRIGKGKFTKLFVSAITSSGLSGSHAETIGNDFSDYTVFEFAVPFGMSLYNEMDYIASRFCASGYDVVGAVDYFTGAGLIHVYIPEIKCAFVTKYKDGRDYEGYINTDMLSITENNDQIVNYKILYDEYVLKAEYLLGKATEAHKSMEKYYVDAMDFEALNQYTEKIINDIKNQIKFKIK